MDGSAIFNSFDGNTAYDSYDQPMTSPDVTQVIDYVTQSILTGQEVPPAAMEYLTNNGVTQNQIDQSINNARYEEIIKSFENPTELTGPTIDTAYLDPNLIDVAPENVTIESRGLPTLLNNSDEVSDLGTIDVEAPPTVLDDNNRNFDFIPEPTVPDDRPYTPFEENFPIQEEPRDFDFIPPPQTPTLDFIAPQTQVQDVTGTAKKGYTYGQAGDLDPNYMLQRQINAGNVYSNATGYKPVNQNTTGEEVEHFAGGGLKGLSDFATRITQPIEKAILRPVGEAAPFLKDLAPYAGIAAGSMMGNPMMAAGIGGIASGFGKPGGFDMKRALMGGIAAYGMSNLAGGLEAAGTPESALPFYPEAPIQPSSIVGSDTMFTPQGPSQAALQSMAKTDLANAPRDIFSTRNPDAMQKGIGNLLENSNSPQYKNAIDALSSKVGTFNTGVPLIMGTTGMMGVDESNALKKEYDIATAKNQADTDKFNARTAAGKKRAQQAVSENPYMFAMGGQINPPDDQTQMANQTPMQNINQQAQMAQSANNNLNNGISGLFNQLTSNQPNNSMSYSPQTGSPQSVVLPSYGDSGLQGNSNIGFAQGGLSSIDRQQQRQQIQQQRQDQRQQMQQQRQQQRQPQQPFVGQPQPQQLGNPQQPSSLMDMARGQQPPGQLGNPQQPFGVQSLTEMLRQQNLNGQFGQPQQAQPFGGQLGQLGSPQNPLIGPQQLPPLSGPLGGFPPQQPFNLFGSQKPPPLSGPLGGFPPQQPFGQPPQPPQYDSTNSTTSKDMGYPLQQPFGQPQQPFGSPQQPTVNSNPTIGPQQQSFGGLGSNPQGGMGYAEGGVPRFLSGGGDGMSDSIRANIEGTQEARLADGEFVIPADVVSHLGNGSSKAGAKQLYDMMDRVRKARTGNPKQGREIKPTKLMPV